MTQTTESTEAVIADPGIENFLSCHIAVEPEYKSGQSIHIKATLVNSGHLPLWVLVDNTFLDPALPSGLKICRDGSSVTYSGPTAFRYTPTAQSYRRVPANDSISSELDVSGNYDVSVPGMYEAFISMPIIGAVDAGDEKPPVDEAALQLTLVNSEKVSFRINGAALDGHRIEAVAEAGPAEANVSAPLPSQPLPPFFRGMNQQEMDKIRDAHFLAYKNIVLALGSVQTTIDTPHYKTWFEARWPWGRKSGWEARRQKVIDTLSAMAKHMATQAITYAKEDPNKICGDINCILAYTYKSRGANIYFCPLGLNDDFLYAVPFYGARTTMQWDYSFIVAHEVSHSIGSTDDHWYSWYMCGQLAVFNPDLAVSNAQNYALFVMREGGGDVPMFGNFMIKCFNQRNGKFLGWLQSDGNWVTLNGTDPNVAPENGCVTVRWYEYKGEKYLFPADSSRYLGDNGNGGQGNGRAAWNLWARASSVGLGVEAGEIYLKANPQQRLGIYVDLSKEVLWMSADAPPPYVQLRCEFQEV